MSTPTESTWFGPIPGWTKYIHHVLACSHLHEGSLKEDGTTHYEMEIISADRDLYPELSRVSTVSIVYKKED